MKDEDLEKTIPIETLKELEEEPQTREKKNKEEATTRESKYDSLEEAIESLENNEEAEEALAEKNIAKAEEILNEEKEPKDEKDPEREEDEKLQKNIKKILIIVGIVALAALLVLGIILLVSKLKKDKGKGNEEQQQQEQVADTVIPVIRDNYYYKEGKLYLLDSKDKEIGEYECINKDENLCFVAYNNEKDNFDIAQNLNEDDEEQKHRLDIYNNNFVFIFDNKNQTDKNIVLYSLKDKETKETYRDVKAFDDNYVIVANGSNKYGLLELKESVSEVIAPTYDYLGMIKGENNLVAKKGNDYIIINKQNKTLSANIPGSSTVKKYNDYLIVTQSGKEYNVYNYQGKLVVGGYTFATIADKYIGLVSNKKLYVRDIDNNKYNETPIDLKNTYYVHRNIYDENNKLDHILASFDLDVKKTEVEIAVYPKEAKDAEYKHLPFVNVTINKNYAYMNYFDKKLYFYSDVEKEKLIGSYSCTNDNVIDDSTTTLNNCMVATDTIYEDNEINPKEERNSTIPIINNRFVFIADGRDNINLYDLVDKKTMVSYITVNTYTPDNGYTITHYSGKMNVVALNKSGSYGMINIDGTNVAKVYAFNYNHLEKMGDYILAQNKDDKWLILYNSTSTSSIYQGKIVNVKDKKYFKVLKDDKYMLYDANANEITNDKFKDITFLDSYFIGVDTSNKLYVYKYDGTKITKEGLTPNSTCSLTPKYKVSVKDNIYSISICNNDKYDEYKYDKTKDKFVTEEAPKDDNNNDDDKE